MKPIPHDPELDDELQELYILSNHWMSDIHFEEDEIKFLKKVTNNYRVSDLEIGQLNKIADFNKILTEYDETIANLKRKINGLVSFIGVLVNDLNSEIRLELIEKFADVQAEMKTLFDSVKQVKKLLFAFTEEVMKTEPLTLKA